MNDIKIDRNQLWTTTIFTVRNPLHGQIVEALKSHIYAHMQATGAGIHSGISTDIKTNLFESAFDFFSHDNPAVPTLKQFCGCMTMETARHVNAPHWARADDFSLEFKDSWFHVTRDGGFHEWHNHPNCSWCGIYYVDVGESTLENGANAFYDPRNPATNYTDYGTRYLEATTRICVPPEDGMLVIFPSYLFHSGTLYRGQQRPHSGLVQRPHIAVRRRPAITPRRTMCMRVRAASGTSLPISMTYRTST